MCPHKRAFVLSSSIIGTTSLEGQQAPKIACPNHKKTFLLKTGASTSADSGYAIATFQIRVVDVDSGGRTAKANKVIEILVPEEKEADRVLGTSRWKITKQSSQTTGKEEQAYKGLWHDERSRRGKYEGTTMPEETAMESAEGTGCTSGGCGDKRLEW